MQTMIYHKITVNINLRLKFRTQVTQLELVTFWAGHL